MNILLLGHNGYLGSYIKNNIFVDILCDRNVYHNGKSYDYIINCIGKPNLEYCQLNCEETEYSNKNIIYDIMKFYPHSKIINFSSYYVYDDFPVCYENSKVTYQYNYTRQKLEGEKIIKNGVTFRLGKLFGNPFGKQQKLTEHIIQNDILYLDTIKFNPTSVDQVLNIIKWELKNKKLTGVFNLSNKGIVSHYSYGKYINKLLNTNKKIIKIKKIKKCFINYGRFLMSYNKLEHFVQLTHWKTDMNKYLTLCEHKL